MVGGSSDGETEYRTLPLSPLQSPGLWNVLGTFQHYHFHKALIPTHSDAMPASPEVSQS